MCQKFGSSLGYLSIQNVLSTLVEKGESWKVLGYPEAFYLYCKNHTYGVCNWLVPADGGNTLCRACELNRTIPNLANSQHLRAWQKLEYAKHRLVYSL